MIAAAARAVQTAVDTTETALTESEDNWLARDGEYAIAVTSDGATNTYAVVHIPTKKVVATRDVDPEEFIINAEDDCVELEYITCERVPERRKMLKFER